MTKSRMFLAGGMLAMMAVIALVFGMTVGNGGAANGAQSGADEAAETPSD